MKYVMQAAIASRRHRIHAIHVLLDVMEQADAVVKGIWIL
jgi:hypothetical protein